MPSILTRPIGGGGAGGNVDVNAYSDAGFTTPITSSDVGDTIYVRAENVSGITPVEYLFMFVDSSDNATLIYQGATANSSWVVSGDKGDGELYVFATEDVSEPKTWIGESATFEVNADVDALAYIAAHNALSGQTMVTAQQDVVFETFSMLRGNGTPNGSDLLTKLKNSNSEIYAFTPVSSSIVSLPTIAIDWIDPSATATIVNFTPADVANDGVTSSTTKYLEMKRSPSDYGQNDVGIDAYSRSTNNMAMQIGAYNGNMTNGSFFSFQYAGCNSAFSTSQFSSLGLNSLQRDNSANYDYYFNGSLIGSQSIASTTPPSLRFFAFGANRDGSKESTFGRDASSKLAMLCSRCSFTLAELQDWADVWDYFTNNMNN